MWARLEGQLGRGLEESKGPCVLGLKGRLVSMSWRQWTAEVGLTRRRLVGTEPSHCFCLPTVPALAGGAPAGGAGGLLVSAQGPAGGTGECLVCSKCGQKFTAFKMILYIIHSYIQLVWGILCILGVTPDLKG